MLYIYSIYGLVAQWTRARGYEPRCQGFESLLAQYSYYIDSKIDIYIQFPYNLLKMGRRQAVRQRTLTPPFGGSSPPTPANYGLEHLLYFNLGMFILVCLVQ